MHIADASPYRLDYLDKWASQIPILIPVITQVTCEKSYLENVWIPNPASLPPRPQPRQEEEFEDWQHDVSALFEWVGMTGLHAQRLQANDRVDPYVAIYEPPTASRVGNVTHLRWRGLLSPAFVQSVIDASVSARASVPAVLIKIELVRGLILFYDPLIWEFLQSTQYSPSSFVAITVHGITNSPVVYLPQPRTEKAESSSTAAALNPPAHLPRRDGEDTWSLVLAPTEEEGKDLKSVLYECVGQRDARWG
ncbi:hypothetical protein D9756_002399 [Leucocoprinus leucothites]|uniref:Uncharacterized protein n=1 Tax=Leucocoprinus leucothites TaxID=201217 RepID=A0A8H5GBB5_9AGAR|nr:hypothetical protein D9756_002399 [Leucoagaricus leucothites]